MVQGDQEGRQSGLVKMKMKMMRWEVGREAVGGAGVCDVISPGGLTQSARGHPVLVSTD